MDSVSLYCVCVYDYGRSNVWLEGRRNAGLLVRKPLGKKRRIFEVNMKMCLGKSGCEGGKWTEVKWLQGSVQ